MNPPITLDQNILFYAFRYALGRSTGAVDDVVSTIRTHLGEITVRNLRQMAEEIIQERDRGLSTHTDQFRGLGDRSSSEAWLELLQDLYAEIARRPRGY